MKRKKNHQWKWPAIAVTVGIIASLIAWASTLDMIARDEQAQFDSRARDRVSAIRNTLRDEILFLIGGAGLFTSQRDVTRSEWQVYSAGLELDSSSSGVLGFGFALRLSPDELAEHITTVRAEGFPEYTVYPEGERAEYTSILYLEPFDERNQRAFGYDMFSEPVRREAMERARDTGKPALSGKVTLVQEGEHDVQAGFLIYVPVYNKDMPKNTIEERRAALFGYVYSPFRAKDFMKGVFPDGLFDTYIRAFDGLDPGAHSLLFESEPTTPNTDSLDALARDLIITMGGHEWTIRLSPTQMFKSRANRNLPWIVLGAGVAISLAIGLLVWSEQRTRTEAKHLRRSEAHLSATLLSIGDGVISTDMAGCVTTLNTVAEQLTGWTEAAAQGHPIAEVFRIVDEETRKDVPIPVDKVLATGEAHGLANHTILIARDGTERSIADSAAPVRHRKGHVLGVVLVFRDTTRERRLELAQTRLAAIVESSDDAIISKTLQGIITSWNPEAERLFGYSASEIVGAPMEKLFPPDRLDEEPRILAKLQRGERVDHFETVRVTKDNRHIDVLVTISPVKDIHGNVIGASKTIRDITERKATAGALRFSELRLEQAMDAANMAAWELDIPNGIFIWNDRFYALFGTTVEREGGYKMPVEQYMTEFCHSEDAHVVQEEIAKAIAAPDPTKTSTVEFRVKRRDTGEIRNILVRYQIECDSAGQAVRAWGAHQDITDRKRIELELAQLNVDLERRVEERTAVLQSQKALEMVMLENLSEGVVACDANGRLTLFNKAAREWHGCDPSDLPQEEWAVHYDLFEADGITHLSPHRIPLVRAWQGEQVRNAEICIAAKGRAPRRVLASGDPIFDSKGSLLGAIVAIRDITDVTESERFARASLDALGSQVAVLDEDGVILATNRSWNDFGRLNGLSPDGRTEGMNYLEVCGVDRVHSSAEAEDMAAGIRSVIRGDQKEFTLEYAFHSSTERRWFLCRVTRFPPGGPVRVAVGHEEITPIKRSQFAAEQALASLDATNDGVYIFDPHTLQFSYVNQGALHQLGYERDDLLRMTPFDIKPEHDEKSFRALLGLFLSGEVSVKSFTTVHRHKDGHEIPVEINLQYLTSDVLGSRFIALVRDITERTTLETERRQREVAEAANRAKSDFLASMSHELRTPLNAIIGFSEVLADRTFGELNAKQDKYIGNVITAGRHLLSLINDILDLSKVEAGKMELDPALIPVKRLLEDGVMFVKEKAMHHNLQLMIEAPDDLQVAADERKLKQVLFNLLSNAVKFTPDGGKILIKAVASDVSNFPQNQGNHGPCLHVSVTDTGIGIDPREQNRLFADFVQLDAGKDRKHQGTGLGLALCRRLVELHEGCIWVESEGAGNGCCFQFIIPMPQPREPSSDTNLVSHRPASEYSAECVSGLASLELWHQQILQTINALTKVDPTENDTSLVCSALKKLILHSIQHLQDEEDLMSKLEFSGLEDHRRAHENFMARIATLADSPTTRVGERPGESALSFLRHWWGNHILTEDKAFREFITAKKG